MLVHEESDAFGKGELTACGHVWAAVQGRARDTGMQGRRWPGAERAFLIGSVCVAGAGGSVRLQTVGCAAATPASRCLLLAGVAAAQPTV